MRTGETNALFEEERFVLDNMKSLIHWILAVYMLVSLATIVSARESEEVREGGQPDIPKIKVSPGPIAISPGKVKFSVFPNGRWKSFTPSWTGGRSLIEEGGFIIYGRMGDLEAVFPLGQEEGEAPKGSFQARLFEGCIAGRRKPASHPDDDNDGLVDEDAPDGRDNDGDGRVDEDFAAIGDEMMVIECAESFMDSNAKLLFHEECYAWSLPNIDRMAVASLRAKNIGTEEISSPTLGAYFQIPGSGFLSERTIESSIDPSSKGAVVICKSDEGFLGMMFFLPKKKKLKCGWVDDKKGLISIFRSNSSEEEEALSKNLIGGEGKGSLVAAEGAMVFGVGEPGDTLRPGEEIGMDLALLCTASADEMENAIVEAFKTFVGDGENRLIPPPVAMERKVFWGSYRIIKGPEEKVLISVEDGRSKNFSVEKLSFLSFMPTVKIESLETYGAEVSFIYNGKIPTQALDAAGRLSLKGKLNNGVIFELLLRAQSPKDSKGGISRLSDFNYASDYFNSPGRLPEELLSSSPNPFRENTTIYYEVPDKIEDGEENSFNTAGALRTQIKIYSVDGRLVSILVDEFLGPGSYSTQWDAVDENGSTVANSVYYVKLQIEKRHVTKRLTYLR